MVVGAIGPVASQVFDKQEPLGRQTLGLVSHASAECQLDQSSGKCCVQSASIRDQGGGSGETKSTPGGESGQGLSLLSGGG